MMRPFWPRRNSVSESNSNSDNSKVQSHPSNSHAEKDPSALPQNNAPDLSTSLVIVYAGVSVLTDEKESGEKDKEDLAKFFNDYKFCRENVEPDVPKNEI